MNLAAVKKSILEQLSRDTNAPRVYEECITQGSEELDGRVTKLS